MELKEIKFTEIEGIELGHAENLEAGTGCSLIACREGAVAGVAVRGGSPATRETDLLKPENNVQEIHGVMLSGGSAFGLEAACGAMDYFESQGVGFDVEVTKVPIIVGASLFDLTVGDKSIRPNRDMGMEACKNLSKTYCPQGNVGAGTGATIGKLLGEERAMKGGLGTFAYEIGNLQVGAIVAVNALGDVVDPESGKILAGLHDGKGKLSNSEMSLLDFYDQRMNVFSGNTTIGAIVTNGKSNKAQMNKLASMSHNGYARAIRPAHTIFDGDTIFTMSTGKVEADINVVAILAVKAMERAIVSAITHAKSAYGYLAYGDIEK